MSSRNPMKDKVAFAGASTTGFSPHNTNHSQAWYTAHACIDVLRQCGLEASDIDGICGTAPTAPDVQQMLGIPEITWYANPMIPFVNQIAAAASAVHAGICDTVLAYHAAYRMPWNTMSSLHDPLRRSSMMAMAMASGGGGGGPGPETVAGAVGYTAWASRYFHEFGLRREQLGLVSLNDRTNAAKNPSAALRQPLTMDDYLSARMIRWPLCILDMDVPVDGGDAFIITTTERAKDLPLRPVLINALALGVAEKNTEDQAPSLAQHGQQVVVRALKEKGDFWIDDCDLYYPYDGFSIIALNWIENAGWCKRGEGGAFLEEHFDAAAGRLLINGRVPVNTHGGALSEGGTQGSGHIREAIHQLQGLAGERQVAGAQRAVLTPGGFFFNAQGLTLQVS